MLNWFQPTFKFHDSSEELDSNPGTFIDDQDLSDFADFDGQEDLLDYDYVDDDPTIPTIELDMSAHDDFVIENISENIIDDASEYTTSNDEDIQVVFIDDTKAPNDQHWELKHAWIKALLGYWTTFEF